MSNTSSSFYLNEFTRVVVRGVGEEEETTAPSIRIYSRSGFLANRYVWFPEVLAERGKNEEGVFASTMGEPGNPFEFFDPQVEIDSPVLGMYVSANLAPTRGRRSAAGPGVTVPSMSSSVSSHQKSYRYVEEIVIDFGGRGPSSPDVVVSDEEEDENDSLASEEEPSEPSRKRRRRVDSLATTTTTTTKNGPFTVSVFFKVKGEGAGYDPDSAVRETPATDSPTSVSASLLKPPASTMVPVEVRRGDAAPRYRNQLQRNLALCEQEGVPREWIYTETQVEAKGGAHTGVKLFSSYVKAAEYYHAKLRSLYRGGGPRGILHDGECQLQYKGFLSSKRHVAEIAVRAVSNLQRDPVFV